MQLYFFIVTGFYIVESSRGMCVTRSIRLRKLPYGLLACKNTIDVQSSLPFESGTDRGELRRDPAIQRVYAGKALYVQSFAKRHCLCYLKITF